MSAWRYWIERSAVTGRWSLWCRKGSEPSVRLDRDMDEPTARAALKRAQERCP